MRKKELENNFGLEIGLKWEKGGGQTCSRNAMQYGNKNWNFKKEKKKGLQIWTRIIEKWVRIIEKRVRMINLN